MKKKRKIILFVFGLPLIIFIALVVIARNATHNDSEYYNSVGLKINGIVTDIQSLKYGHDYGIISINVSQSNVWEYDKRNQLERYLGVIKNKKAELIFNRISSTKIGDSIVLNVQDYKLFRKGKLIVENTIGMPPSNFFFTPFREIKTKIK